MKHPWKTRAYLPVLAALSLAFTSGGCADGGFSTLSLPLYVEADYFTLQIVDRKGASIYDTGCLRRQAKTFRVSNLEEVDNASILFNYYSDVSCSEASHIAVGLRGDVAVVAEQENYFHVPVLANGAVTALPAQQNVSAGFAIETTYCEPDSVCEEEDVSGVCKKAFDDGSQKFKYWCVPTCSTDADCVELHDASSCDPETRWCTIPSPFPLNMSGPRAFGQAMTTEDGDVYLVGGFSDEINGLLTASGAPLERYNSATGLFEHVDWANAEGANVAMAGATLLDEGALMLVGGVTGVNVSSAGFSAFTGVSGDVLVISPDAEKDKVKVFADALTPVVAPGVLNTDVGVAVVGGLRASSDGAYALSDEVYYCDTDGDCVLAGILETPRVAPSLSCVDEACTQILVVGGNRSGATVERLDWSVSTDTVSSTALESSDLPSVLETPIVCDGRLVAGADGDGAGLTPMSLSLEAGGSALGGTELENVEGVETALYPAVIGPIDGDCWVFGGQSAGEGGATSDVWRVTPNAVISVLAGVALETGRYGALIAAIGGEALDGSVLIAGGLEVVGGDDAAASGGAIRPVHGAEIFRP